jgi:hypothetical protein
VGRFVIAAYRPRAGKAERLLELVKEHLPILRAQGLATERPPYVMRAADGTLVEVFEWQSDEAARQAHNNPAVLAMWARFGEACEYDCLASLAECKTPFPHFEPVDF